MSVQAYMGLLLICSTLTSLGVEALKKQFKIQKYLNLIVLAVSIIFGAITCVIAYLQQNIPFTALNIVYMIVFAIGNWFCAVHGYDKIKQTIEQFNK